jgi:hypothetical protein
MDRRRWMYEADRREREYFVGLNSFVRAATAYKSNDQLNNYICCPCVDCNNEKQFSNIEKIREHLIRRGFKPDYTCWSKHGEDDHIEDEGEETDDDGEDNETTAVEDNDTTAVEDNDTTAVEDTFDRAEEDDLDAMLRDGKGDLTSEREFQKYERMREDSRTPLYPGCKEDHTKLHTVLTLLQLKASNGWSDKSFTELLDFLGDLLPEDNVLPLSTYQAKQVVCPLGLEVQRIHACRNDCILYRNEHEELDACTVCKASRYKRADDVDTKRKNKRAPAKVLWYFPIIPRLKRMFMNRRHAELLRWHAEKRKNDAMLRHPADCAQWRNIDTKYKKHFACDVRNIRFGLSTDGMNPFGNMSSRHSTWPVTLCMYNLPPWLCMKRKYIMMPLLIQGPKQPGNDIDVYLKPLVDDLLVLWNDGVRVWDQYKREYFTLHAMLFVTINDYPALGNLSGQTIKGYNGCVQCLEDTGGRWLKNSRKMSYTRHRRFLRKDHPYRNNKRDFDGTKETASAPQHRTGKEILSAVKDINIIHGKGDGSTSVPSSRDKAPLWKKRSLFWDLPYWKDLHVRHAIDVMHVEKNVCDNLLGILLDIPGKSKDMLQARMDLKDMNIRKELHHVDMDNGKKYLPTACYTLSKKQKTSVCESLHGIKVPSGYSANIQRLVSMKDLKLIGMKSHDCHVMMTQMLPIALRGVLPDKVYVPIIKLCSFFNVISQKVIDPMKLVQLQKEVVETLCRFEMCFPPSFFDVMVHLIVHIVFQIQFLGPVFLHQMYPFERFMGILKKYVRNRSRPEGCIVEAWGTEEVVEFCIDYMDLKPIGVPLSRHEGRLQGVGTLGHKSFRMNDGAAFTQAHFTVLNQSIVVDEYMKKHMTLLWTENPSRSDGWIARMHREKFGDWLLIHMMHRETDSDELRMLSAGPSTTIVSFQGYDINGYTFYTRSQDNKSTNQNSGVCIDAYDSNGSMQTYYGFIEEIWVLDYGALKLPVFRCQWVSLPGGVSIDKYGITTVDLRQVGYREEPFILASTVKQIFFVTDPANKQRHIVLQGKRRIVGVDNVVDEEGYNQFDELPPFGENVDINLTEDGGDGVYVRHDHSEGRIV